MFFKLYKLLIFIRLFLTNKFSKQTLLDSNSKFLVSLTSYNKRLNTVFYAIESIGWGSVKPNRIILWLTSDDIKNLPDSLDKLKHRGLEIKEYKDIKSYKKLIPVIDIKDTLGTISHIVTIDDDIIYPRSLLKLFALHNEVGERVIESHRARKIIIVDGKIDNYNNWPAIKSSDSIPEFLIFPTGGGGTSYPVEFLSVLEKSGDLYLSLAPEQDDVWFWAIACHSGYKQQYIDESNMNKLIHPPGSQLHSLWSHNVQDNQKKNISPNDLAIEKVIERFKLEIKV